MNQTCQNLIQNYEYLCSIEWRPPVPAYLFLSFVLDVFNLGMAGPFGSSPRVVTGARHRRPKVPKVNFVESGKNSQKIESNEQITKTITKVARCNAFWYVPSLRSLNQGSHVSINFQYPSNHYQLSRKRNKIFFTEKILVLETNLLANNPILLFETLIWINPSRLCSLTAVTFFLTCWKKTCQKKCIDETAQNISENFAIHQIITSGRPPWQSRWQR